MALTAVGFIRFPEIFGRLPVPKTPARRWKIGNHRGEHMSAFAEREFRTGVPDYWRNQYSRS